MADAGAVIVYILDDDDAVRNGFARLLRSAGLEPRAHATPESFLAAVVDAPRTCLLLDITMPTMTGPQVQQKMIERGLSLPVITISAKDDDETRTWARQLGAGFFLRKPVDDRALLDAIHWLVDAR